jgi:hypothetical protein
MFEIKVKYSMVDVHLTIYIIPFNTTKKVSLTSSYNLP